MIEIPVLNELLIAHNCLHSMSIQLNEDGAAYDLLLSISISERAGADVVNIKFMDLASLRRVILAVD
jgi:hypothetical protein